MGKEKMLILKEFEEKSYVDQLNVLKKLIDISKPGIEDSLYRELWKPRVAMDILSYAKILYIKNYQKVNFYDIVL